MVCDVIIIVVWLCFVVILLGTIANELTEYHPNMEIVVKLVLMVLALVLIAALYIKHFGVWFT